MKFIMKFVLIVLSILIFVGCGQERSKDKKYFPAIDPVETLGEEVTPEIVPVKPVPVNPEPVDETSQKLPKGYFSELVKLNVVGSDLTFRFKDKNTVKDQRIRSVGDKSEVSFLREHLLRQLFRSEIDPDYEWKFNHSFINSVRVPSFSFNDISNITHELSSNVAVNKVSGNIDLKFNLVVPKTFRDGPLMSIEDISTTLYYLTDGKIKKIGTGRAMMGEGAPVILESEYGVLESTLQYKYQNVPARVMEEIANSSGQLVSTIENYLVRKDSESVSYRTLIRDMEETNARVIVSTPASTQYFYEEINDSSEKSLNQFLADKYKTFVVDSNNTIIQIDEFASDVFEQIDYYQVDDEQLNKRRWFYLNDRGITSSEKLVANTTYLLLFCSIKELLFSNKVNQKLGISLEGVTNNDSLIGHYNLGNVKNGDEITIKFKGEVQRTQYSTKNAPATTWNWIQGCDSCQHQSSFEADNFKNNMHPICPGGRYRTNKRIDNFKRCGELKKNWMLWGGRNNCGASSRFWCLKKGKVKDSVGCNVNSRQVSFKVGPITYSKKIKDYRISFYLNGKKVKLNNQLYIKKGSSFEKGIVNIKIDDDQSFDTIRSLSMQVAPDSKSKFVKVGYLSDSCVREARSDFSRGNYQHLNQQKYSFTVDTFINGIVRDY